MKYEYYENKDYELVMKEKKVSSLVAKAMGIYDLELDNNLTIDSPYKYAMMQDLVGFLLKAISDKKKIMVYGDYDVDGICSVSILKRTFDLLNTNIGYYIPSRYLDGYGINNIRVEEIVKKGYEILICIDNGVNAISALEKAKEKGLKVIILDHHTLNAEMAPCDYYLHPTISKFSSYNMCASSIAYYLSMALLAKSDDKCAILAGLATLSDVMPLISQNKLLVRQALTLLNEKKFPQINFLLNTTEFDTNILCMQLIPRFNSVGRIVKGHQANELVKFLLEEDKEKFSIYAKFINDCNEMRKNISNDFYNSIDKSKEKVIIAKNDELPEGVAGIVASRIVGDGYKLAIIFAKSEDGRFYKGSGRSSEEIDLVNLLGTIDYFEAFGGHSSACGLTIKTEDFDRFKADVKERFSAINIEEETRKCVVIDEADLTYKNYLELLRYGPFGEANPYPLFALKRIDPKKVGFSKDRKHLIIKLNNDVSLLGFNLANRFEEKYNNYEAIFTLDKNNLFKNKLSCKCEQIMGGNNG